MGVPKLPLDLIGKILDQIHPKLSLPTPVSQDTFACLARTSKQFLAIAREHLYARPLLRPSWIYWPRAEALLESLVANNGQLGKLVICLDGLVAVGNHLAKNGNKSRWEFERSTEWYFKVLKACPNVRELDLWLLPFFAIDRIRGPSTPRDRISRLEQLQQALFDHVGISSIILQAQEVDWFHLDAVLRFPFLSNVSTIKLQSLKWQPDSTLQVDDDAVHRLSLRDAGEWPQIDTLHVDDFDQKPDVRNFIQTLAPSLRHLVVTSSFSQDQGTCSPLFDSYNRSPRSLPSSPLSPNRFLRTFLQGVAPSLSHLRSIDLRNSRWYEIRPRPKIDLPTQELVSQHCSERSLRRLFEMFTELERVDLGVLPTMDENGYASLRGDLAARGVEVRWKYCRSSKWCERCETEHD